MTSADPKPNGVVEGGRRLRGEPPRGATAAGPLVSVVTVVLNRPGPLADTIESVRAQTYSNIEHVIVDGGSSDDTLDVIRRYEDRIDYFISEPDRGVYDAINKGIRLATGDYVCILHAADLYDPSFISDLMEVASAHPGAVVYSGYRHGERTVRAEEMSAGILFHYLGINHSTFLVPANVYRTIGLYDDRLKIVSDAIWMRSAFAQGVKFVRTEGHGFYFAPGGLSTAKSAQHTELVVKEVISSYRREFSFLPAEVCRSIYRYRFDESEGGTIALHLAGLPKLVDHPEFHTFRAALGDMLQYIWPQRAIDATTHEGEARVRVDLARRLGIPLSRLNIISKGGALASYLDRVDELAARAANKKTYIHFAEVFSRPSETFIHDFVGRLSRDDSERHIVLCEKRRLEQERPFSNLLAVDSDVCGAWFFALVVGELLNRLPQPTLVFHFAANGWRLLSRIDQKFQAVPAVYMTHGVDVFSLSKSGPYSEFIKTIALSPTAHFTAVTAYLREELVLRGIPRTKISIVNNAVHDRFFAHRTPGRAKTSARIASGYDVRILNIGRLVEWKRQNIIVEALAVLQRLGIGASLTLVYGEDGDQLAKLRSLAKIHGVQDRVEFVPFVDFNAQPDYFSGFDLFVSSAGYSSGPAPRSETFGVAILEAIAGGLPVIVTNAGGQPEVVGEGCTYARMIKPDDPADLANAIKEMIVTGVIDGDNLDYAKARLEIMSARRQETLFREAAEHVREPKVRVGIVSSTLSFGAGGAARRVHKSLLQTGVLSRVFCRQLSGTSDSVPFASSFINLTPDADRSHPTGDLLRKGHTIFSFDTPGLPDDVIDEIIDQSDVINLQWYARFISNRNIARFMRSGKPVVVTIRDMHPLTGGCHYFHGCTNWRFGCAPCPQILPSDLRLPGETFAFKARYWDMTNVTVVVLSEHTRKIVSQSPIFGGCRIEKISNPVELDIFRPYSRDEVRAELGVPPGKKVIAYLPSFSSEVKGGEDARAVFAALARRADHSDFVVILAGESAKVDVCGLIAVRFGRINDPDRLARFYSAADVTLVPSHEETFSNTTAESIACGTPVIGYQTGAIGDLAADERGRAVAVGDTRALVDAVLDVLSRPADVDACRRYMENNHSLGVIGGKYRTLFEELARAPVRTSEAPVPDRGYRDEIIRFIALSKPGAPAAAPVSLIPGVAVRQWELDAPGQPPLGRVFRALRNDARTYVRLGCKMIERSIRGHILRKRARAGRGFAERFRLIWRR